MIVALFKQAHDTTLSKISSNSFVLRAPLKCYHATFLLLKINGFNIVKRGYPGKPPITPKPPKLPGQRYHNPVRSKVQGQYSNPHMRNLRKKWLFPKKNKETQNLPYSYKRKSDPFDSLRNRRQHIPTPNTSAPTPAQSSAEETKKDLPLLSPISPLKVMSGLAKGFYQSIFPSSSANNNNNVLSQAPRVSVPTQITSAGIVPSNNPLDASKATHIAHEPTSPDAKSDSSLPKVEKIFMNHHGWSYTTTIKESITLDSLTETELESELRKRQLIKEENKHTMNLDTEGGGKVDIGITKNLRKLTPMGVSYHEKLKKKEGINENNKMETSTEKPSFFVVVPPNASKDTFIEVPEQKHLIVGCEKPNDVYYGLGYFTSKPNNFYINDVQFHKFQKGEQKALLETSGKKKKQYFVQFDNAQKLPQINSLKAKDGDKYIEFTGKKVIFQEALNYLKNKPFIYYSTTGVTKEQALSMCLEYDKNMTSQGRHPESLDVQNEISKIKSPKLEKENVET